MDDGLSARADRMRLNDHGAYSEAQVINALEGLVEDPERELREAFESSNTVPGKSQPKRAVPHFVWERVREQYRDQHPDRPELPELPE